MKIHHTKISGSALPFALKMFGSIMASCSLLLFSLAANATTISGDSTTILRIRETTDNNHLFPLYEYLHLSASDAGQQGATSVQLGVWGRVDLWDKSTDDRTDGDVQYGFLSYRANRNNLQVNAGRQFVTEGVATERVDGLYFRSDLAAGFTAAAFVGSPVVTDPNFDGGEIIYGGRVAHVAPNYYSIGVSALRNEADSNGLREEEGVDLWLHPMKQLDITGRSSYSSLTRGWMEHAYSASFIPTDSLRISASLSQVNYRDYFHHVTTSALSLTNGILSPAEEVLVLGAKVGFTPVKSLAIVADYQHFDYDLAGNADYFGGGATFTTANALSAGLFFHRMDGSGPLQYNEFRVYASQKFGPTDVTLDLFDVYLDDDINGIHNTYSLAAAAGYNYTKALRFAADIDYMRSSDLDHELRGLIKVVYVFDSERGAK